MKEKALQKIIKLIDMKTILTLGAFLLVATLVLMDRPVPEIIDTLLKTLVGTFVGYQSGKKENNN